MRIKLDFKEGGNWGLTDSPEKTDFFQEKRVLSNVFKLRVEK